MRHIEAADDDAAMMMMMMMTNGYDMWFTAGGAIREPQTPEKYQFLGVTQPPGVAQPLYSRGHN